MLMINHGDNDGNSDGDDYDFDGNEHAGNGG